MPTLTLTPTNIRQLENNLAGDCKSLINPKMPYRLQMILKGRIQGLKTAMMCIGYNLNEVETIMTRDIDIEQVDNFCDLMK